MIRNSDNITQYPKEYVLNILTDFIKHTFDKTADFEPTSIARVYKCKNALTPKDFDYLGELLHVCVTNNRDDLDRIEKLSPHIFIGRNFITAETTQEKAIERLHKLNRWRDPNMFEVVRYRNLWIAYD